MADYGHLPYFVLLFCSVILVTLSLIFRHFLLLGIIILRHFVIHFFNLSGLKFDWLEPC